MENAIQNAIFLKIRRKSIVKLLDPWRRVEGQLNCDVIVHVL